VELEFIRSIPNELGRPSYDPADLLKIYLYGYFYKIRTSRDLARETHRNLELIWLIKRLKPDFRTLSDFKKENRKSIQNVYRKFTLFCHKIDLFGGKLVAIDGSKFKGVNSMSRNYTQSRIKMLLERIDHEIQGYMVELDEADQNDVEADSILIEDSESKLNQFKELIKEKQKKTLKTLERAQKRKEDLVALKEDLKSKQETQVSLTDPDARKMKMSNGSLVGYNVQTAVDSKHKLIVALDVTQAATDQNELASMCKKVREVIDTEELKVVADKGYFKGEEIAKCENLAELYVPQQNFANIKTGLYPKSKFIYDKQENMYRCPGGQKMVQRAKYQKTGLKVYATSKCGTCTLKPKCTLTNRTIQRSRYADSVDRVKERVEKNPDMMKRRREIVEHPFGTIKSSFGFHSFLTKGLESVRTEMSLTALVYNLKRAIKVRGMKALMESI